MKEIGQPDVEELGHMVVRRGNESRGRTQININRLSFKS